MRQYARVVAALVACLPILVACGFGPGAYGLPGPPEDTGVLPTVPLEVPGPADIVVQEFRFHEFSQQAEVDLQRPGTTTDLAYNHITGELRPINGARVASYDTYSDGWWGNEPDVRVDYPSEHECRQMGPGDWRDSFNNEDLAAAYSSYCIQTAEGGDFGFLFIRPDTGQKPVGYWVYSLTWVR